MSPIQTIKKLPTYIKYGASVLTVLFSLAGGLWALEDRYVSEQEAASSLTLFNQKITQDFQQVELRILTIQYDNLTESYYKYKRLIRENPNDTELLQEFEEIKNKRSELKIEINKLLRK